MTNLTGVWIGNTFGTHPGTVYAEISQEGVTLSVSLKINIFGNLASLRGTGKISDKVEISLQEDSAEDREPATVNIVSRFFSESSFEGTWQASTGAAGVLRLNRYGFGILSSEIQVRPPQVESRETILPTVRLGRSDLEILLNEIQKQLPRNSGIVVTVSRGANRTLNFAHDFLSRNDLPVEPSEITIASTQDDLGAQKQISITIGTNSNVLRVSWNDLQWVLGVSTILSDFIKEKSNRFLNFYAHRLSDMHWLAFLALLIFIPDLIIQQRAVYMTCLILILYTHMRTIKRLARTVIYLGPDSSKVPSALLPAALSILTTTIGGILSIMLFEIVKNLGWFQK